MPKVTKVDNKYDFIVEVPETDDNHKFKAYIYLDQHFMVEETWTRDDYDYDDVVVTVVALADIPELGLCEWNSDDGNWDPVHEKIQQEYIGFLTEKEILNKEGNNVKSKRGKSRIT